MLPTLTDEAPSGPEWLHEIKHDGYRTMLSIQSDGIRTFTRNGHDWSRRYRAIVEAAGQLQCSQALLDGEIIVQDGLGRSDFDALPAAIATRPNELIFYAFDLLSMDGVDLRQEPLTRRRLALEAMLSGLDASSPIQFSAGTEGDGKEVFAAAAAMGLEGIVSKRANGRYVSGRSTSWLKTKNFVESELVILAHERTAGPMTLLLGRRSGAGLTYEGSAIVSLAKREREELWSKMQDQLTDHPAVELGRRMEVSWVRPVLTVSVRHLNGPGKLRHATVRRLLI